MRALIQRVIRAAVRVEGITKGSIGSGMLVLLGVAAADTEKDADYLADKLIHLRIFSDEAGKMNRSALDARAAFLVVSQFTLYGDCRKGRRPAFDAAAPPARARELYEYFTEKIRESGIETQTGVFQAHMEVELVNDGPVTFLIESPAS
ncbi:MAG TPA: D-aminoacyl-tRNA deacylase [Bryobacteraceae bacterium]|nr:D-aminoacyl-tRNA deacylase [Bryobacteraceae bacterium]